VTSIAELGEFGLIARIAAAISQPSDVLVGIGDDAAVLDTGGDELLVATCDAQVEDIHFRLRSLSSYDLGRRALAVNLSDLAAMGARPRFALVSLLLPPTLDVAVIDGIYAGLQAEATQFHLAIVGGNIARNADRLIVDITLLGTGVRGRLLRRDQARPGEVVMVTGSLGMAAAGVLLTEDEQLAARVPAGIFAAVRAAQNVPTPRVAAGQWLAEHDITTAIDISDGLAADLAHICAASHVGVQLDADALPIDPDVTTVAKQAGRDPQNLALFGGEDYELLFTVPADRAPTLAQELFIATGVTATVIGTIRADGHKTLVCQGRTMPLVTRGWDHLRTESLPEL
jgi:thiamine-monophosphate kinase